MQKLQNLMKEANILLTLSIMQVVLAVLGFSANFYTLFYGALYVVNLFPLLQFLAFIVSIPVYGFQLVNGCYLTGCCTRVLRGQRDPARFGKYYGGRSIILAGCCGSYLLLLVIPGFIQFAIRAQPFVPSLGVWGSIRQVFQDELTGQLVLLGSVVALPSAIALAMSVGSRGAAVYHGLKRAEKETVPLVSSKPQNSTPPPPYKEV
ncbi:uncharacterized protein LOC129597287 [Paramacrobiotus metropolitanus]|uniref:uncharacterized protein LOC129597287 n=1 Tax=Paramacrobiotus metropolitanus TaxID=2943436 RepID=UPI002445CB9C|nr:uncharacterized protein LOC129597287 [Paramacrobiotus metropolitanus]